MIDKLIEFMEIKKIVSLYIGNTDESFYCGKIDAMDKDFLRLKSLSIEGHWLGYYAIRHSLINRIDIDSKYEKNLLYLSKKISCGYKKLNIEQENEESNNVYNEILEISRRDKYILSITTCSDLSEEITGIVKEFDDEIITIDVFNEYGEYIERVIINIDNVQIIGIYDKEHQRLEHIVEQGFNA